MNIIEILLRKNLEEAKKLNIHGVALDSLTKDQLICCFVAHNWVASVSKETPVICWVSNCSPPSLSSYSWQKSVALISGFDAKKEKPYLCGGVPSWKYATPVKPEDCYAGVLSTETTKD